MQGIALLEHLEHLDTRGHDHRRQRIGEKVRTGTLAQHVDNLLPAGGETAHGAAESLSERARENIDPAIAVELLRHAAAAGAYHTGRMALIHHHQGVILLGQVADLVHRGHVAVHGEHAVRTDDAETLGLGQLQLTLQVGHVGIGIPIADRLAQTHAVNDGCVVQGIRDNGIIGREQGLEHATVGIEARRVQDRILGLEEFGNSGFQLFVQVLGTTDKTDGGHPEATLIHGLLRRLYQAGAVGQAQVVVGAEIQGLGAVFKGNLGTLGRCNVAFTLVQARFLDGSQFGLKMLLEFSVHGYMCYATKLTKITGKRMRHTAEKTPARKSICVRPPLRQGGEDILFSSFCGRCSAHGDKRCHAGR